MTTPEVPTPAEQLLENLILDTIANLDLPSEQLLRDAQANLSRLVFKVLGAEATAEQRKRAQEEGFEV